MSTLIQEPNLDNFYVYTEPKKFMPKEVASQEQIEALLKSINKRIAKEDIRGEALEIVSECPDCGCPIYGKKEILSTETPIVKRTCYCTKASINPLPYGPTWYNPNTPLIPNIIGNGIGYGWQTINNGAVAGTYTINNAQ